MRKWVLPEYIDDILPAEADRIEALRRSLLDHFRAHGYRLVQPPLVEHLESLLTGTGHDLELQTFKVIDPLSGRLLGVRANRVISAAVLIAGVFAATAAVMLSVQDIQITSTFGLQDTIVVLAGVVVGGMNRPIPATLGGFSIGFAYGLLAGTLPSSQSQYLPSYIFAAVIVVLLVRPNGLFTRGGAAVERV